MLLRQSCKDGIKEYTVSTLQQARDIVGLMSVVQTHAIAYSNASRGSVTFLDALETIMDQHEIYGIMKEMLLDFGDCMFTLVQEDGSEFIMNLDYLEFKKPKKVVG